MPAWTYVATANFLALFSDARTDALVFAGGIALSFIYVMRPRRIYFVRHGETEANAARVRQGPEGSLSENGRMQAEAAGAYLAQFPIRSLISSPYPRAAETAAIISARIKLPVSYSPLLVERRNPSEVVGKRDDAEEVLKIINRIDRAYHEDDFRYSDEENFIDLKERARRCLDLLASQGARDVCAVTHSIFLKMVIAFLLHRDRLHASDYVKLSFFNASDNAGITVCQFNPWKAWSATRGWSVITYNVTPYAGGQGHVSKAPRIPAPIS